MTSPVPDADHLVRVGAAVDQLKAELSHLVSRSHDHNVQCEEAEQPCPGEGVFNAVVHMHPVRAKQLLMLAIAMTSKGEELWHEH